MVRTKASSSGMKVSGAKAPRKNFGTPTRSVSVGDSSNKPIASGNSYHPRETPDWQKPITTFFIRPAVTSNGSEESGSSKEQQTSSESAAETNN